MKTETREGLAILSRLALVVGLVGGAICIGISFFKGLGGFSTLGDCGTGCQEAAAARESSATFYWYAGWIGGAVLTIGGIIGMVMFRMTPAPDPDRPARLPKAVASSRRDRQTDLED